MNLQDWKRLCRKAWENDFDYLQEHRFEKKLEGRYNIGKCNTATDLERTTGTKHFWLT